MWVCCISSTSIQRLTARYIEIQKKIQTDFFPNTYMYILMVVVFWCMVIRKSYFDFIWHCIHSISCKYSVQWNWLWIFGPKYEIAFGRMATVPVAFAAMAKTIHIVHLTAYMHFIQINTYYWMRNEFPKVKQVNCQEFFYRNAVYSLCINCLTYIWRTILDCFTHRLRINSAWRTIGSRAQIVSSSILHISKLNNL